MGIFSLSLACLESYGGWFAFAIGKEFSLLGAFVSLHDNYLSVEHNAGEFR